MRINKNDFGSWDLDEGPETASGEPVVRAGGERSLPEPKKPGLDGTNLDDHIGMEAGPCHVFQGCM